jgi:hypothetical protein
MGGFGYTLAVVAACVVIWAPELWPVAAVYAFLALCLHGVRVLNRWAADQERGDE